MHYTKIDMRMKRYELSTKQFLTRRTPVIMRLDGRAFHTFTKGLKRPFDDLIENCMHHTMLQLCKAIPGCVFGYTQSDEITLVLIDYQTTTSEMWFDGNIQKMTSLAAAEASVVFNLEFSRLTKLYEDAYYEAWNTSAAETKYLNSILNKCGKARFDCRVFNIPKEEVCNNLIWRQQDATRNSIQGLAQAHFTHSQLNGKNTKQLQEMLLLDKDINWNNLKTHRKRGCCCIKRGEVINQGTDKETVRGRWVIDTEPPIFTKERSYIEQFVFVPQD